MYGDLEYKGKKATATFFKSYPSFCLGRVKENTRELNRGGAQAEAATGYIQNAVSFNTVYLVCLIQCLFMESYFTDKIPTKQADFFRYLF
jgi:hypothetical protein